MQTCGFIVIYTFIFVRIQLEFDAVGIYKKCNFFANTPAIEISWKKDASVSSTKRKLTFHTKKHVDTYS